VPGAFSFFNPFILKKMEINQVLDQHNFEVKNLLRRYRVMGEPTIDTIKKAHDQHGETFMMRLLNIITPTSNLTPLLTPISPFVTTEQTLDTKTLSGSASTISASQPGKVWTFWEKLLNGISSTGETIGGFKDSLTGSASASAVSNSAAPGELVEPKTRSMLIYGAAGLLVVVVVLILIFRKK
jgi:hypothetical protein